SLRHPHQSSNVCKLVFLPTKFSTLRHICNSSFGTKAPLRISPHAGFVFFICWKWKKLPRFMLKKAKKENKHVTI
ncbi:MAG: hypothetical protein RR431_03425, partial [Clostridia bacterium]